MVGAAASAASEHAQAMGVVEVEDHVGVGVLDGRDLIQGSQFAGHAEHALGDEEYVAVGAGGLGVLHALQSVGGVVVGEGGQTGLGVFDALEDAGVVFPVAQHGVGRGDEHAQSAQVGAKAGDVDHHMALAHEIGQALFEVVVEHHVAA